MKETTKRFSVKRGAPASGRPCLASCRTLFRAAAALLSCIPVIAAAELGVANLRCECLKDPLGIDVEKPRLSWVMEDPGFEISNLKSQIPRGQKQTAYQVLVASAPELLAKDQGDLWDSGKVASDQSIQIEYAGKPLESRARCHWKVRVWDRDGKPSDWSRPALWSMGLLKPGDWQAKWIEQQKLGVFAAVKSVNWIWFPEGNPAVGAPAEARYFRRVVTLPPERKIARAVCQITADNSFEVFINGKKAGEGNDWTAPAELDVTGLMKSGTNSIAVLAVNSGGPGPAGLLGLLRVEFTHGESLVIPTDGQWKAAKERKDRWERYGFDDSSWAAARVLGPYGMAPWDTGATEQWVPRYFRREFQVTKPVVRATAYVFGQCYFDLFMNGQKVSADMMNPTLSDHTKALFYVTFDVTKALKPGANALGVILGNSNCWTTSPGPTYPKLLLQLEVESADGTKSTVVSDEKWRLTTGGPIRSSHEYHGEEYDARMEMPGWNSPGFDDAKWEPARPVAATGVPLVAQMLEPMRVTQVIRPKAITSPAPGMYLVDMGQNFYGTVRLKAAGPRGTTVRLTSAYSLKPDGMLKTADNRTALCTDVYTFKGQGTEVWSPRFKGQGFRRVQVTGFPGVPTVDNFEGLVIHNDVEPAGEFQCSNDLVNRIHTAMRWGMRMFLRGAPLDPDRDERLPWNGDPAKDAESEAYNFNVAPFYTKWMGDVRRSQRPDGTLPNIALSWHGGDGVEWPSVFTIIPDWLAEFYGDRRAVETHYTAMKAWLLAKGRQIREDGTLGGNDFGDWCDAYTIGGKIEDFGATSRELISTAYHYNNCRIMERWAGRLSQAEDQRMFADMAGKVKLAFNRKFLDPKTHVYQGGTQCAYLLPLAFGLVPDEQRDAVIANLANDILVKHNGHLSVGLIGMQWLMQTLTDIGRPDLAWTVITQTTRPSFGYMLSKGATTIWERWDMDTRDPGMNSEALLIKAGNVDAWFYQTLAGINYDRDQPGFKHVLIRPQPLGDLTWVKAHHDSPYGRIVSNWKRDAGKLTMNVTIPANTTAVVFVPAKDAAGVTESGKPAAKAEGVKFLRMENNAAVYAVGAGVYRFQSTLPTTTK